MKLPGPQVKMPTVKAPTFLVDLFYDLHDRRLLPLIALVLVAIAAVPFLLGGESSETAAPSGAGVSEALGLDGGSSASLTVVEAEPGLRDYRTRLRRRSPADPFQQQYTAPAQGGGSSAEGGSSSSSASSSGGSGSSSGSDSTAGTTGGGANTPSSNPGAQSGNGNSGGSNGGGHGGSTEQAGLRYFGYRSDVRFGVAGSGQLALHKELPLGSLLPKQNSVLVFIGVTQNGKRALFDPTSKITSVRGNGDCVGGKQSCEILSMRAGTAVDLLVGSSGRAYRLNVVRIDFVELDSPSKGGASDSASREELAIPQSFSK